MFTRHHSAVRPRWQHAFSLLEMLAVITILGIVAAVALPRFTGSNAEADRSACFVNKGDIELQVQIWRRNHGTWPAANLSDIGTDSAYFPEGLPICPVDGSPYTISATGMVVGHVHKSLITPIKPIEPIRPIRPISPL